MSRVTKERRKRRAQHAADPRQHRKELLAMATTLCADLHGDADPARCDRCRDLADPRPWWRPWHRPFTSIRVA